MQPYSKEKKNKGISLKISFAIFYIRLYKYLWLALKLVKAVY